MNHDFTTNGSNTFKLLRKESPSADDILYHIRKFQYSEIKAIFERAGDEIFKLLKSQNLFQREVDVAIDFTDNMYYGNKNDNMVIETKFQRGTTHAYRFATINIVLKGMRFTLMALPLSKFSIRERVVNDLIEYAKRKIRIKRLYVDRGFFSIDMINLFKKHGLKFLMPAIKDKRVKKAFDDNNAPTVIDYTLGLCPNYKQAHFKLAIIEDQKGKVVFATNFNVIEKNAHLLGNLYSKRWGIETSYRVKDQFRPRTTSKNYSVRFFYFMFSVCLYNLWILASIYIGLSLYIIITERPLITAKMFGILMYSISSDEDRG